MPGIRSFALGKLDSGIRHFFLRSKQRNISSHFYPLLFLIRNSNPPRARESFLLVALSSVFCFLFHSRTFSVSFSAFYSHRSFISGASIPKTFASVLYLLESRRSPVDLTENKPPVVGRKQLTEHRFHAD